MVTCAGSICSTTTAMITSGPDSALWATLLETNAICRITTDGQTTMYPLPTPDAGPVGIAAGPDAVWFVEIAAGQIVSIDASGHIRELPLPDRNARPHAIVADPGGGFWFTEWAAARVGHIAPNGEIHHVAVPQDSEPHGLAIGPDHALWIALEAGSVARLDL
jgi:virginiamycin B lyase